MSKRKSWFTFFSLFIPLCLLLIIEGGPLLNTLIKSFTDWNGTDNWNFIGIQNYAGIFTNKEFGIMLQNSFLVLIYVPIAVLLGLIFSITIFELGKASVFVYLVYLPQILSSIIAGKIFQFLFALDGPINKFLNIFGLPEIYWFGGRETSFLVIILCLVWIEFGWQTIYQSGFLSTKNGFVKDLLLLDGAGFITKVFWIYAPLLWNAIKSSLLITIIFSFSDVFPLIFVMTQGGPGYGTTTLDYLIYQKSFSLSLIHI